MKKAVKILGVILILLVLLLVAIPYLFKDKIKEKVVALANENINATLSLDEVSVSFLKSFPKVEVQFENVNLLNKAPFVGDTLFSTEKVDVKMSIADLISGKYNILGFTAKNASVFIHFNKEGQGNYDIALPSDAENTSATETTDGSLSLEIQSYTIDNLNFKFKDDDGDILLTVNDIHHTGKGNFANELLDLDTQTNAQVSFSMGGSNYMSDIPVSLQALLGIDLKNQKYTFKENKAIVNRLDLVFDGFIQLLDEGQRYDLTFGTPSTSFQNFLALLPAEYAKNIDGVTTTGDFTVNGKVKGDMVGEKIPAFALEMMSNNASFKYPDLPKTVRNINIDVKVNNDSGIMNDTYIDVNKFTFTIDQDQFSATSKIRNIVDNPMVNADLKGTINLANLSKAYPIDLDKKLSGIFKADITTQFDMNSIEKEQYQNLKNQGSASLQGFVYEGEEFVKPFHIEEAALSFSPSHVELSKFASTTGDSDLKAQGRLDNLYGFLFNKEVLKGNFALTSNKFVVGDFMQSTSDKGEKPQETTEKTETSGTSSEEALKVPSFLDCTVSATAKTVVYDNLQLKNVSGKLIIKDEKISIENLKSDLFDGMISVSGGVSTKETEPTFDVDLSLSELNVAESFSQIEMLSKIAPIAKFVQGKLNSKINVKGTLTDDLTPNISSISGDMLAELLNSKVSNASPLLSALSSQFTGLNLSNLNLNDLKTSVSFANGKVNIKPFTIKYNDMSIEVGGSHGFDQTMDYKLTFDVPAKMLGSEAASLLSKLTPENQEKIENIPVVATLGGTFASPKVSTDMKQALTNLTTQIAKSQAENLKSKGKEALQGLIGSKTDSSTASTTAKILESITKSKDSTATKTEEEVKEKAKEKVGNVLKGILGGKKEEK